MSDSGGSLSTDDIYHLERHYDAFVCRLTKKVMQDPVTIENGLTFEREAIEKWFKQCRDQGKKPVCPLTKKELKSTDLNRSIALRKTIKEWTARNEAARLDIARKSLSAGASEGDIMQAFRDIQYICQNSQLNGGVVLKPEMILPVIEFLKNVSRSVRCKALETLCVLAEADDDKKELIAEGDSVRTIVKFLTHGQAAERVKAVSLLYELSKSKTVCEKIGSLTGAILILVGMTSSRTEDAVVMDKADKTLDNLAVSEYNVHQMAECGRLEPLLQLILTGSDESRISMASFLGDSVLNNDVKVHVAKTVGPALINLMRSSDMPSREASLKALNQISSFDLSSKVLIESGILPPLMRGLFAVGAKQLPMRLKEVSATILSNLVSSGYNFGSVVLGPNNQTLVSEQVIHSLIQLISNTGPAIECKLLQVLAGLTSPQATVLNVVSAIKSSGATTSLVQFIEASDRDKDLRLACIKLLHNVSLHMSQELADALRGTTGELGSLIKIISEKTGITEEQAEAVGLLADLPPTDVDLTREMLGVGAFQMIISRIRSIRGGVMKGNRYMTPYLEGLVRVLARVTYCLGEEPEAIALCMEQQVPSMFVELLQVNGLDNVQIASAWALENLSLQSKKQSRKPDVPPPGLFAMMCTCFSRPPEMSGLCRVHGGICALDASFCLLGLDALAIERLVALLDHTNEGAVEASLAAISTLLDDEVDIEQGVLVLKERDTIYGIFDVLVDKRSDSLRKRAIWAVERLLRNDAIAFEAASDQRVSTALVDAYQHADYRTKQIAEKALRHIDKIPNFSGIFSNIG